MDGRQQRGAAIAAKGEIFKKGYEWIVASQSIPGRKYTVNPFSGKCTCPDNVEMDQRCKHVWAATFMVTAETHEDGTTTVTETATVTYARNWQAYNEAQTHEKERFVPLLADLCSAIPQAPRTTGRPRLPMGDMAFAATYKVYSRFSSRRFASDLRDAQADGLITRAPHFNSVTNYMSDAALTPVLHELIETSALPLKVIESDFAVDSSGFSTSRFDKWMDFKYGKPVERRSRHWLKAHLMVGVKTNVVSSVEISEWNEHDNRFFAPLLERTASNFTISEVSADKAYLARKNLDAVEAIGATPFIPFKSSTAHLRQAPLPEMETAWSRMYHWFAYNREDFMNHYHKRSNVETTFSMIKGKFGDSVMSKSETGQVNEVLCKVLAHNVVVAAKAMHELGIAA